MLALDMRQTVPPGPPHPPPPSPAGPGPLLASGAQLASLERYASSAQLLYRYLFSHTPQRRPTLAKHQGVRPAHMVSFSKNFWLPVKFPNASELRVTLFL